MTSGMRHIRLLLAGCVIFLAAGCNKSSSSTYSTTAHEKERQPGTYATERRTDTRTISKSESSRHDMTRRSMAFPTGAESSSLLLVTKEMPNKLRAGAPFEYKLTVRNIADQPLEGVVVYDRIPSDMTVRVAERDEQRIMSQDRTVVRSTEERFVVRTYDAGVPGRDPFLPRYTPIPTAEELKAGEVYAVDRDGRRTADGRVELGPAGESEVARAPAQRSVTRVEGQQAQVSPTPGQTQVQTQTQTQTQTRTQTTRTELRDQKRAADRDGAHADHARHQAASAEQSYLAGEWFVGHLAPGESRTLTLKGTAPQSGALATCTTVAYQPTICLVTEVVKPELQLQRIAPARADACEEITITYRVTNIGTGDATGITIEEQLPEGVTLAGRQSQQAQAQAHQGRNVRFQLNTLRQGQSEEFTTRTRFDKRGTYRGRAIATDEFGVKVQSEETVTQAVAPELAIDLTGPEQGFTSRPVNYTVKITNNGDGPANDLKVRLNLPAGVRSAEGSNNGRMSGNQFVWENLRAIEPGQSLELKASIQGASEGSLSATATADARCAQPVSDTLQTALQSVGSLLLEVVDTNDPVPLNSNEVYRIRVTNQGDKADRNVRIVVTLPDEMDLADSKASVQPQTQGKVLTFTIPTLDARASETIQVSAKAIRAGDVRIKVEMNSDTLTSPVMETEATRLY